MAYFKVVPLGDAPTKPDLIEKEIHYILRPQKHVRYYGGNHILITDDPQDLIDQFYAVRHCFGKYHGIQARHFVLSFSDEYDDVHAYQAYLIGKEICKLFRDNQIVYAVHEDTDQLHIHFVLNPVDIHTGKSMDFGLPTMLWLHSQVGEILRLPGLWYGKRKVLLMGA